MYFDSNLEQVTMNSRVPTDANAASSRER
ncbi:unnamed protein product, partial [Rotaria magnacalcarata]